MSLLIYILIMQIGFISTVCTLVGLGYFGLHAWRYIKIWWDTPSDEPVVYGGMWPKRKRQCIVMAVVLIVGISLPSRNEAIAMTAAWKVANASVWDRLFTSGNADKVLEGIGSRGR
jgi:accessory gene regulator protein AgrB